MKPSTTLPTANTKRYCVAGAILLVVLAAISLFTGKYPLSMQQLLAGDAMQWRVFLTLRCSRTVVGIIGGFALGVSGFVYQTVFGNPLDPRTSSAFPREPVPVLLPGFCFCPVLLR